MKLIRGVLLLLLGLTALLQFLEGLASVANPAGMIRSLGLTMSPGVEVPMTFLGLALIVRGAVTTLALEWVRRGKPEGLFLARFTALTILLSAPVAYWKLGRMDYVIGDLVQGLLLIVPAWVLRLDGGGRTGK